MESKKNVANKAFDKKSHAIREDGFANRPFALLTSFVRRERIKKVRLSRGIDKRFA